MAGKKNNPEKFADTSINTSKNLRQRAEELLQQRSEAPRELLPEDFLGLVHDLQVHQIELEMQNKELRRTQHELELTRDRYLDLYDFAPVGYVTLNEKGMILKANLTAAAMLKVDRGRLIGQFLSHHIFEADQDIFYFHRKRLFKTQETSVCELRMVREDDSPFWVRIEAIWAPNDEGPAVCRATLSNITEHKQTEEELHRRDAILEAVSFAAERFLESSSWENNIQDVLEHLGQAADVSCVCIFEIQNAADGSVLTKRRHEWTAPEVVSRKDKSPLQNHSFREDGFARWEKALGHGRLIHGHVGNFPASERRILASLGILSVVVVPIFVGSSWWGGICFEDHLSERKWSLAEQDALRTAARALGAAIKSEHVEDRLRQRNLALETLYQTGQKIVSSLDLEQVVTDSLDAVCHLFQAKAGSLWLTNSQTNELICQEAVGLSEKTVTGWRLAPGQGIAGWVFEQQEGLVISDTQEDPRHYSEINNSLDWNVNSMMVVPLQVKDKPLGVIEVVDERLDHFDDDNLRLLESLAAMIAIALENAQLYDQTQQHAETNALLLREVNHRVKNNLTAIEGILHIEQQHPKQSYGKRAYQTLLNDLINRIKGLSVAHQLLSASRWSSLPLSNLVQKIISTALQTLPSDRQVLTDISTSAPIRVSAQQAHNLALIINELTTNVAKYATQADETVQFTIDIDLEPDEETICLEFRDDGPGFPEDVLQSKRRSTGLYLVQNAVRRNLRGEVELHNDGGAVVTVRFPKTVDDTD